MNAAEDAVARLTRLKDAWLHDYAEQSLIQRAALAKGHGLKPEDFVTPLPGTVDSSVTNNYFVAPTADPVSGQSQQVQQVQPVAAQQSTATVSPPAVVTQAPATAVTSASPAPTLLQRVSPWILGVLGAGAVGFLGSLLHSPSPSTGPAVAAPVAVAPAAVASPAPAPAAVAQPAAALKPVTLEIDYKMGPNGQWIVVPKQVNP